MTLQEIMKKNKIVVGVKHILAHKRELIVIKDMLKFLRDREAKLNSLGSGYHLLIVREGGLLFIFNVQRNGNVKKIVNWESKLLFDYVKGNKDLNKVLWELV